jgi:C-terminal processing protease CtpA/Prc
MQLMLALFLLAQAPPTAEDEAYALLVRGLDTFDARIDEFETFLTTRYPASSNSPKTGMALDSPPEVDAEHLHPLVVRTVIVDSPADRAGIRPGDRVTRIGTRRMEHESPEVFRVLTEDAPGPLEVGIRRGTTDLTVTMDRTPIVCLQRSAARIDQEKWRNRIAGIRRLTSLARADLDDQQIPAHVRHVIANGRIQQMFALLSEAEGLLSLELTDATTTECGFRTIP